MNIKHLNEALLSVAATKTRPKARAGRGRWLSAGLLLAILAAQAPARAQGAATTARGRSSPAPAATGTLAPDNLDEKVKDLYDEGRTAARAGKWEKARKYLLEAFEQKPHFQIAANLGEAELMAGKPRDAAEHLSFFLRGPQEVSGKERSKADQMLELAKEKVGTVTIQVDTEGAVVLVNGQKVGTSPLAGPVFVEPGSCRIEVQKDGRSPASLEFQVAARAEPKVELRLKSTAQPVIEPGPAPTPRAPSLAPGSDRSKTLIGAGIGLAGGLAGAGIGAAIAAALTERASMNDWDDHSCTSANSNCRRDFDVQEKQRFYLSNTAVWALVGAGVVGGATAVYALTGKRSAATRAPSGALVVSPQGGGVVVAGSF